MLSYIVPLVGAMLADSILGRYRCVSKKNKKTLAIITDILNFNFMGTTFK